jgi:hypothetical protein
MAVGGEGTGEDTTMQLRWLPYPHAVHTPHVLNTLHIQHRVVVDIRVVISFTICREKDVWGGGGVQQGHGQDLTQQCH